MVEIEKNILTIPKCSQTVPFFSLYTTPSKKYDLSTCTVPPWHLSIIFVSLGCRFIFTEIEFLFQEEFPFDENVFNLKSDAGIKSYFEDLPKKHTQFNGNSHGPQWSGSVDKDWERAYTVPIVVEQNESVTIGSGTVSAASSPSQYCSFGNCSQPDSSDALSKSSLRHTVDIADQIQKTSLQNQENEPKRSSSAPPGPSFGNNIEPKRFTTKIEITPVNPFESKSTTSSDENDVSRPISHDDCSYSGHRQAPVSKEPPPVIKNPGESTQPTIDNTFAPNRSFVNVPNQSHDGKSQLVQTNHNQPQVHHIPIFVEGRTDPIIHTSSEVSSEKNYVTTDQAPLKCNSDGSSANKMPSAKSSTHFNQNPKSSQEGIIPLDMQTTSNSVTQSTSTLSTQLPLSMSATTSSAPVSRLDSQQCVDLVQEEVDILTRRVEQYSGTSRNDKEYLYLDEMLTRNLIRLDTIEVEGNEQLRTARKNVIKSIQKSIALLESKILLPIIDSKSADDNSEQVRELQTTIDVSAVDCVTPTNVDLNEAAECNESDGKQT